MAISFVKILRAPHRILNDMAESGSVVSLRYFSVQPAAATKAADREMETHVRERQKTRFAPAKV
jgi:hypothetical protein